MTAVADQDLEALVRRLHHDPHAVLGPHPDDGGVAIRAFRPAACEIKAQLANGTYDEDKKLDGSLDKLLDDLLK